MRSLQTSDIFSGCRLIKAVGAKEEIKKIALEAGKASDKSREELGFDLIFNIFDKAVEREGEKAIYEFLSGFFECAPEEIAVMDPVEAMEKVLQVADIAKWKVFFTSVARLMRSN